MTLSISMQELLYAVLYAGILGVLFAFVYDILRVTRVLLGDIVSEEEGKGYFRQKTKHVRDKRRRRRETKKIYRFFLSALVFCEDVLFFVFVGITYSIFLYWMNHGVFRFLFLLSSILGFLLYRKTAGKIVLFVMYELAFLIMFLFEKIIFLLKKPIFFVYQRFFVKVFRVFLLSFRMFCDIIKRKIDRHRFARADKREKRLCARAEKEMSEDRETGVVFRPVSPVICSDRAERK